MSHLRWENYANYLAESTQKRTCGLHDSIFVTILAKIRRLFFYHILEKKASTNSGWPVYMYFFRRLEVFLFLYSASGFSDASSSSQVQSGILKI